MRYKPVVFQGSLFLDVFFVLTYPVSLFIFYLIWPGLKELVDSLLVFQTIPDDVDFLTWFVVLAIAANSYQFVVPAFRLWSLFRFSARLQRDGQVNEMLVLETRVIERKQGTSKVAAVDLLVDNGRGKHWVTNIPSRPSREIVAGNRYPFYELEDKGKMRIALAKQI